MKHKQSTLVVVLAGILVFSGAFGLAAAYSADKKVVASRNSESSVTTNANGSISRTFSEVQVTTNGTMVTEVKRETTQVQDADGHTLGSSTSEYRQIYSIGDATKAVVSALKEEEVSAETKPLKSFMGLEFGAKFDGEFTPDRDEPTLLRAKFTPKTELEDFDDYYVYVTPTTHRVAKVYACSKKVIEPGVRGRRHYLIEALEKRFGQMARPCDMWRPIYAFDPSSECHVRVFLSQATEDYETLLVAWNDDLLVEAENEIISQREAARKTAQEQRRARVEKAAAAF